LEALEKIVFVILGVLLSGAAYLLKRRIEGKPQLETLDKHKKLLDIHKQMNEQGIDIDGLRMLEERLAGKANAIKKHTKEIAESLKPLIEESEQENLTQIELNERAKDNFEKAKEMLQEIIAGIDSRVGDKESQAIMNSQTAWEGYSVDQAMAAASSYEGGSIWNFIYFSELESLTVERAARLQAELDELIRLGN
jgi:uncharacterized protein YecT (DUF1311 family)